MPRKPIDYSKCVFYRLVCRDVSVTECYVGHTTNEVKRRAKHKSCCTNEKTKGHNVFVYRFIREHGGWDNWQLILHEKHAVKDIYEAVLRERHWCEFYKSTLNKNVPGRTPKEWHTKYHAEHREELNKKKAAYRSEHREEINQKSAAYHAENREKQNQRSATWHLANSDRLKTKHSCACGGKYTNGSQRHHIKSKKHLAYLAE